MNLKIALSFFVFIFLFQHTTFSQKQNNNWHFGNEAAISFNGSNPVSITTSKLFSVEGCASVSDANTGNLLFYTNGQKIWNANNDVMSNGNGLLGGPTTSSSQGVLIVAYPNNPKKYFVFTVDETNNNAANGFRYSIVDMSLDNGLGNVEVLQKNILIQTNTTERLSVAKKADGKGFWVLTHERDNNVFKAFEITNAGLNTTPIISNVGLVHSTIPQTNGDETMGCVKFNNAYNKVAIAIYAANGIEVFDFDNCTGIVSNPITIATLDNPYGVEFSPDDSKLYYSLYYNAGFNGAIFQLNMLAANIALSAILVGISSSGNNQCMGALQLAPDGKIYAVINSEPWLSAITQPNLLGVACGFVDKAITLLQTGIAPSPGLLGLPQKVLQLDTFTYTLNSIKADRFCKLDSTIFSITGNLFTNKILWNFGDNLSPQNNDTALQPFHIFSDTGTYKITGILSWNCSKDTLFTTINIINCNTTVDDSCSLTIPNVFSPNGDAINDKFYPLTSCNFEYYELLIYTRWGQPIFSSRNFSNKWNGKCNGNDCPIGAYYYLVKYKFPSQQIKKTGGMVALLR